MSNMIWVGRLQRTTQAWSSQLTAWDLDLDALFGPALAFGYGETLDHDTTIHELRLISSSDSSLAWLAGVYSFDLDTDATGAQFVDPDVLALFGVDSSVIPKDRAWGGDSWVLLIDALLMKSLRFMGSCRGLFRMN